MVKRITQQLKKWNFPEEYFVREFNGYAIGIRKGSPNQPIL